MTACASRGRTLPRATAGSIGVARHKAGPHFPAKASAKDQVAHGLVVHHFRWSHQHLENDPGFAAIDDRVHVLAQVDASILQAHRRRIRIRCHRLLLLSDLEVHPLWIDSIGSVNVCDEQPVCNTCVRELSTG